MEKPSYLSKENLEILAQLRPIDDDLMRELFRDNLELAQFVLRIILDKPDLVLISQETQYDMKRLLGARSLCLDVFAVDSDGKKYDIEVQRADKGASPKRARYHSSAMDIEFLNAGDDFTSLPITYTIFITENDLFNANEPVYRIERINTTINRPFNDDEHILYVNGAYVGDSDIGKLMHDFRCSSADDMNFNMLADRTRYYKEHEEGVSSMCKIVEDRVDKVRAESFARGIEQGIERGIEQGIERGIEQGIERGIEQGIERGIEQGIERGVYESVIKLIKSQKLTLDEIAEINGLPLEKVKALAEGIM